MSIPTPTPTTTSNEVTVPGITFSFRLLDVQGNMITLTPDMDDAAAGDLRVEGSIRLLGDHRTEAFQAFARALTAAGGPYSSTPALVRAAVEVPLVTTTDATTPAAATPTEPTVVAEEPVEEPEPVLTAATSTTGEETPTTTTSTFTTTTSAEDATRDDSGTAL